MCLQITLGEERGSGHLHLAKNRTCHIPQGQPMTTGRPNEGQTRLTISEAIDNGLDDPMSQRRLRKTVPAGLSSDSVLLSAAAGAVRQLVTLLHAEGAKWQWTV
jgi:hypothetical protein